MTCDDCTHGYLCDTCDLGHDCQAEDCGDFDLFDPTEGMERDPTLAEFNGA